MTTLHEARVARAARLVAAAVSDREAACEAADVAEAIWFAARDVAMAARIVAWASGAALAAAQDALNTTTSEGD